MNKEAPGHSTKLERLRDLLSDLSAEEDRKIVLFSEWTTMLDLIEPLFDEAGLCYVRLDGSVPQRKRQALVAKFQDDPSCRAFLTTNAGSTGLNLQAANTVINVDLPWNPAVLEQRIARAHRMGQDRPVQVYLLVTVETIEENLLATLSAKHELAQATLDPDSEIDAVHLASGMDELKRRLEVLLGRAPEAPLDESAHRAVEEENRRLADRRERFSTASGELLGAAFVLLGELLPESAVEETSRQRITDRVKKSLNECIETDETGRIRLSVTLPDRSALDRLAEVVSRFSAP